MLNHCLPRISYGLSGVSMVSLCQIGVPQLLLTASKTGTYCHLPIWITAYLILRLELEMPGPALIRNIKDVTEALDTNKITNTDLDSRILNFLKLLRRTGKFTDRFNTPEEIALDRPEHRALIRKAGSEGIVLLKNENKVLPLNKKSLNKIALLGPLANYAAAHGGGSASLNCHYKITPFEAFTQRLGSDVSIKQAKGEADKKCIHNIG